MRRFSVLSNIAFIGLAACLGGCGTHSPYAKGKSAADIPAHINVVEVKEVAMIDRMRNDVPERETNPSQNDQEVTAAIKKSIIIQLTNYGYKIIDGPQQPADVALRFYIYYQPERWPLVGRIVIVLGIIDDTDGSILYKASAIRQNSAGLIGAMAGPSRDEMVSDAAREAVVKVVTEIQKGTKNNVPVTSAASVPATPVAAAASPYPVTQ